MTTTVIPAATPVTPSGILISGALPTAADDTMTFANDGRTVIAVCNGSAGSINVTEASTKVIPDGGAADLTVQDRIVAVAAGETRVIGPFPTDVYNDAAGVVTLTFSAKTTVTVQALRVTARG